VEAKLTFSFSAPWENHCLWGHSRAHLRHLGQIHGQYGQILQWRHRLCNYRNCNERRWSNMSKNLFFSLWQKLCYCIYEW